MLKDVKWSDDGTYTPQGEHTPFEFFTNALENSIEFDIQLGYFNSAAINIFPRPCSASENISLTASAASGSTIRRCLLSGSSMYP